MKQKTFFTIAAIALVIVAGYFTIQLGSMPILECNAMFTFECDAYLQLWCLANGLAVRTHSWCELGHCWGNYRVYCPDGELGKLIIKGTMQCDSGWDGLCGGV